MGMLGFLTVLMACIVCGQESGQRGSSLNLICKSANSPSSSAAYDVRSFSCEAGGTPVMLNFSLPFSTPNMNGLVVGGKNVLFVLDRDLKEIQRVETANITAKEECIQQCRTCSAVSTSSMATPFDRDRLCASFNGTCPEYVSARCNSWYSNVVDGGLDHAGNRLVVTCSSNYLDPVCQLRLADNITHTVLEYPARQSPSFDRRLPQFTVYNSSVATIDSSNRFIQPVYTAGYIYTSDYLPDRYASFGDKFTLSIRRLHSASFQPPLPDLYQDGDMPRRINQDITSYGEYVYQFERNGFIYIVMRDFGRPITPAYGVFSELGQAYVLRYCKNDNGTEILTTLSKPTGFKGFSSLMRTILVCRSLLKTTGKSHVKKAYFAYRYVVGATTVTINNRQFLFVSYNSYRGDPSGAAICAHPLDKMDELFRNARDKAFSRSACDIQKSSNAKTGVVDCSKPSRSYLDVAEQSETFNSAFEYDLTVSSSTVDPLWSESGVSLNGLASHTLGSTVYLYTAYNDSSVAVFSMDTNGLSKDTKLSLQHTIPVSLPNNSLDVILDMGIADQLDSEAVLAVATQYQVIAIPPVNCRAQSNCSVCVGAGGSFFDSNCGWCAENRTCTVRSSCDVGTWISSSYDRQKSAKECSSLPPSSRYSTPYPGDVRTPPVSVLSMIGSKALFTCVGQGSAPLTISWMNSSSQTVMMTSEDGRITITQSGTTSQLEIKPIRAGDGGQYSCVVRNALGNASAVTELKLPPVIVKHPPHAILFAQQFVELRCIAGGYPTPTKLWRMNGVLLDSVTKASLGIWDVGDGNLMLENVNQAQEGSYSCLAINDHGVAESLNGSVKCYDSPLPAPIPVAVVRGEAFNASCNSSAAGSSFQWYLDNVAMTDETASHLVISSMTLSMFGVYMCQEESSGGVALSTVAYAVEIQDKPLLFRRPLNKTAGVGSTIQFRCEAVATVYPETSLAWWHSPDLSPGVMLTGSTAEERSITMTNNNTTLTVFGVTAEHYGWYRCVLTNAAGSISAAAYLTVTEPPQITSCQPDVQFNSAEDAVVFSCTGSGDEPLDFQFYKDNVALEANNGYALNTSHTLSGEITSSVAAEKGAAFTFGVYSCRLRTGSVADRANCSWVFWTNDSFSDDITEPTTARLEADDGDGVSKTIFGGAMAGSIIGGACLGGLIKYLRFRWQKKKERKKQGQSGTNGCDSVQPTNVTESATGSSIVCTYDSSETSKPEDSKMKVGSTSSQDVPQGRASVEVPVEVVRSRKPATQSAPVSVCEYDEPKSTKGGHPSIFGRSVLTSAQDPCVNKSIARPPYSAQSSQFSTGSTSTTAKLITREEDIELCVSKITVRPPYSAQSSQFSTGSTSTTTTLISIQKDIELTNQVSL